MTLRFLGIVVLVAGLTAIQLLPFLDLLAHSQRQCERPARFGQLLQQVVRQTGQTPSLHRLGKSLHQKLAAGIVG